MELQTFIGLFIMALGLMFYFMAFDAITAIPGNVLFFSGCIVACWGAQNEFAKSMLILASFCLLIVMAFVAWLIWGIKKNKPKKKESIFSEE